jgi:hypothetical protein
MINGKLWTLEEFRKQLNNHEFCGITMTKQFKEIADMLKIDYSDLINQKGNFKKKLINRLKEKLNE